MFRKQTFVIAAIAVYVLAAILYLELTLNTNEDFSNCWDNICARFCCDDRRKCSPEFIKENFNLSAHMGPDSNVTDYETFYGKPSCFLDKVEPDKWKYSEVSAQVLQCHESEVFFIVRT